MVNLMSADMTERALSRRLITLGEALEQTGARDLNELHRLADVDRRRMLSAA